jgi:hypothetical protein
MLGSNQRPLPREGSEAVSYASYCLAKFAYLSRILSAVVSPFLLFSLVF